MIQKYLHLHIYRRADWIWSYYSLAYLITRSASGMCQWSFWKTWAIYSPTALAVKCRRK